MRSAPLLDCAGRRRSPATLSGLPPGPATAKQGIALSTGPADRGGDHCRDARRRRSLRRSQAARRDRRALARRVADQRSARPARERSRPDPRRRAGPPRQGRQAPRGRDGPLGLGAARAVAHDPRRAAGWTRCSACSGARPAAGPAPHPGSASNCATPPARPGCAAGSRRTSSATRTPSRWSGRRPATGHPTAARSRRPRDQWRRSPRELRA